MAHLYPHLRIHQVFGANTDVGKTIFTTALCLASAALPRDATASSPPPQPPLEAAALGLGERVHYLKPVSTGNIDDSDDAHIASHAPSTSYTTLYRFAEPVSPHLAVELEKRAMLSEREVGGAPAPPTDVDFVRHVGDWLHDAAAASSPSSSSSGPAAVAYVETAGGVHSPGPSGTSQSQLLRPLRLPTILIGSSELGGISTTRSAYESLMMNGYDVEAVLLFPSRRYGNVEYLRRYFQEEHGIPVWGLGGPNDPSLSADAHAWGPPPVRNSDSSADRAAMQAFYRGLVQGRSAEDILRTGGEGSKEEDVGGVYSVVHHLRQRHQARLREISTLASRTRQTCWWPFTQHTLTKSDAEVNVIDSAHGDFFAALDQRGGAKRADGKPVSLLQPLLDGSASWWTQCLGHAPNRLVQAAAKAGARYGHVLFPNGAHEPALYLAEALTGKHGGSGSTGGDLGTHPGAGWASRAFFSDNGSTGMEVAIKMAIQSSLVRYSVDRPSSEAAGKRAEKGRQPGYMSGRPKREWEVLGLKGSYHGDTIGAMDACEPSVYSEAVDWYRGRGHWFEPPLVEVKQGRVTISLARTGDDTSLVKDGDVPESLRPCQTEAGKPAKVYEATYASMQEAYDVEARLRTDPLASVYRRSIRAELERLVVVEGRRFGAVILEPLVMGAGGMLFVDPLFQRTLIDVVRESEDLFSLTDPPSRTARTPTHNASRPSGRERRDQSEWQGLPIIFDEVFAGLYRLGHATTASVLGVTPDISCLAKILTGGMVPMSVTLASSSIFETFSRSESKVDALLHGHSYTAHPIGCQVALETLRTIAELKKSQGWTGAQGQWLAQRDGESVPADATATSAPTSNSDEASGVRNGTPGAWSFWSPAAVDQLSKLPNVDHAIAMGCVLKVCLKDGEGGGGYTSTASVDILKKLRTHPTALQGHASVPASTPSQQPGDADAVLPFNVHARPLGNVIYFMSSLNTPNEVLRTTEKVVTKAVREAAR
ncbi:uncharacterized protein PFL1_01329 [Pseudozyma flocculosa PF-1]|uniref:Related to Adenosylmethionine-8-amino-7-oxononanoate aminotransferase n=1 Tax=Pseudozyma flocculosa TaxID=84751 RepID=A0A5C3EUQ6_9BASI|nr:uncharacterized protein PFL1_01329 [Pseudozyma flocculosa PF-1]EPQ31140.1 hypothetical protein PFL1_01329 [Pseudozyma flocculosa PF-1]SPO36003.1 related to Adenosylmethionine-8-amino-7-oxononanoate aminotransferase [Pseudozyma flocculosa]